ncbi:MAG: dienelactone hydrolase family protein [Chloroflexia bacterium]|nr:dienelactone hydrolase family protein [Chloroflexia bacterium]
MSRIDETGCGVVFQGTLPSAGGTGGPDLGPSDIAIVNGQIHVLDDGGSASHGIPLTPDCIYAIDGGGSARLVADIGSWVRANPVVNPPENLDPDGNPTSVLAGGDALGVYSDDPDDFANEGLDDLEEALNEASVTYEINNYPDTGHAFHNDTGQRYNEEQALVAWKDTFAWFAEHLGGADEATPVASPVA